MRFLCFATQDNQMASILLRTQQERSECKRYSCGVYSSGRTTLDHARERYVMSTQTVCYGGRVSISLIRVTEQ